MVIFTMKTLFYRISITSKNLFFYSLMLNFVMLTTDSIQSRISYASQRQGNKFTDKC